MSTLKFSKILLEDFKTQKEIYIKQGYKPEYVDKYLKAFRIIKDRKFKPLFDPLDKISRNTSSTIDVDINDRNNIDKYSFFSDLKTIVDYVYSQVYIETVPHRDINKTEVDGEIIYKNDIIEIYRANSAKACVDFTNSLIQKPSWCISAKPDSNLFGTYRFNKKTTIYFVKNILKPPTDQWHVFVIQVFNEVNTMDPYIVQYMVTSSYNNGEKMLNWNSIELLEPNLQNLQKYFISIPIAPYEKEKHEAFKNREFNDSSTFCLSTYQEKKDYIDRLTTMILDDTKFDCLPESLKLYYINTNHTLTRSQYMSILNKKELINRYSTLSLRIIEYNPNYPVDIEDMPDLSITQLYSLLRYDFNTIKTKIIPRLNKNNLTNFIGIICRENSFIEYLNLFDKNKFTKPVITTIFNNLNNNNITTVLNFFGDDFDYSEYVISLLSGKVRDKEFIEKLLTPKIVNNVGQNRLLKLFDGVLYNKKIIIEKLYNTFKNNLLPEAVYILLRYSDNIIDMAKILGRKNLNKLSINNILNILEHHSTNSSLKEMFDIIIGKDRLNSFNEYEIKNLLIYLSRKHSSEKINFGELIGQKNINKLSSNNIDELFLKTRAIFNVGQIPNRKLIEALGTENLKKISDETAGYLLTSNNIDGSNENLINTLLPKFINISEKSPIDTLVLLRKIDNIEKYIKFFKKGLNKLTPDDMVSYTINPILFRFMYPEKDYENKYDVIQTTKGDLGNNEPYNDTNLNLLSTLLGNPQYLKRNTLIKLIEYFKYLLDDGNKYNHSVNEYNIDMFLKNFDKFVNNIDIINSEIIDILLEIVKYLKTSSNIKKPYDIFKNNAAEKIINLLLNNTKKLNLYGIQNLLNIG